MKRIRLNDKIGANQNAGIHTAARVRSWLWLSLLALAALLGGNSTNRASGATLFEGFENASDSYNLATSGNGFAAIVDSPVFGGSQALELSLSTSSDYARVKIDISSYGISLGQITSADYWVDRTEGAASDELPYIIFSINTPGSGGDGTLAVMYNNPVDFGAAYTDLTVGPDTLFHVEGDTTGLSDPSSVTLSELEDSTYSPGVSWGSFDVDYYRIGFGEGGDDGIASTAYVDNVSINTANVPEPATWGTILGGLGMLLGVRRLGRHST